MERPCLLARAFDRSSYTRLARVCPCGPSPHKTTESDAEAALARHENPRRPPPDNRARAGMGLAWVAAGRPFLCDLPTGPVIRPLCRTHSGPPPSLQQPIVFYPLERQVPTLSQALVLDLPPWEARADTRTESSGLRR
ncbi:BZ3500_MvSof-1268-A1-R1_Chr9g10832 [Microbotryum saponariae]|uniref:BZ3500_MvSof-1268-A1-R1_Chr9g10832 protein n=1 Tax=Microbotryum saponariae TaxID=289078 RepID=A0A2X0LNR4_9BASI|nr:BZ3501_MvSof-1269-A2-R1_Chr9g10580 [Microbotryum saponariae]SDA00773.1 BZ3500_MvSof-1268-A1-R1_Chr9g10832 [Microbotryum saponariae]